MINKNSVIKIFSSLNPKYSAIAVDILWDLIKAQETEQNGYFDEMKYFNDDTKAAFDECEEIIKNPQKYKQYSSFEDALKDL